MEGDPTETYIRQRIEQFMGKDWMDAHRDNFTVDLFDDFLDDIQPTNVERSPILMTPVWDMTGSRLSMALLAIVAHELERKGSVLVRNVEIDPATPVVTTLGFKIVHGKGPNEYLTQAVRIKEGTPA
jgi:hypothetical protein